MNNDGTANKAQLDEKIAALEAEISAAKTEISQYRTVFDHCPMMIWFKDNQNNILKVNKLAAQATNQTPQELENHATKDFYPGEADAYYQDDLEVIQSGQAKLGIIETIQTKNGKISVQTDKVPWYDAHGNIKGVIVLVSDITVRKKYEEEIYQSQKLKSLGILAGGLAHDLNNLLSGITGNIDLAALSVKEGEDCTVYLSRIKSVLDKARHLTQQLLTFAQGGAPVQACIPIEQLIYECIDLFSAGSNVNCKVSVKSKLHNVHIDAGQISQVFNNLILNAQQAMPNGGTIDIDLENITRGNSEFVRISIKDRGQGISPENAEHIFDPFFSTKEKGTGLGLSISHSIIKRHGGEITFNSNEYGGTTFHILLPASFEAPVASCRVPPPSTGIKARVLVMDDDQFILDSLANMLKAIGCDYHCVRNGTDALNFFKDAVRRNEPYDAVILDLTIHGGMGGKETIKRLRELNIPFKSLVSSGYSNDPVMSAPQKYGFDAVLRKPFGLDELRLALKGLLS
jgi:two-component system cell cycle sensor histidine kinase/response regulator CckA